MRETKRKEIPASILLPFPIKHVVYQKLYTFAHFLRALPGGELNPGLPRDRRGYSPLYYRGVVV